MFIEREKERVPSIHDPMIQFDIKLPILDMGGDWGRKRLEIFGFSL